MKRDNARRGAHAKRVALCLCALLITVAARGANASSEAELADSRAVVETLHESLLQAMRAGSDWSFEERRARLDPVLRRSFDFAFMGEKATGRYWAELAPEQRNALIEIMAELASTNYAMRFNAYQGERFETTGSEAATHNTTLVRTRLIPSEEDPVALDYRLRPNAGGQVRIVDVFLNGTVSELALRRAEYSSVLQREGFDALLAALRGKIAARPSSGP